MQFSIDEHKENIYPTPSKETTDNDNIEGKLLNIDENKMQVAIVVQPPDTSKDNLQSSEATTVEQTDISKVVNENATE